MMMKTFVPGKKKSSGGELGPLDRTFRDTNMVLLVLFGVCCGLIAFILSLIGYLTAKDAKAKSNALIVLLISGCLSAIGITFQILNIILAARIGQGGPGGF